MILNLAPSVYRASRGLLACLIAGTFCVSQASLAQPTPAELEAGQRIYLEGILPSGAPLTGSRFGNTPVSGAKAACVNCHRYSGMGQVEGDIQVPPITGNFLYAKRSDKQFATMDPRVSKFFNQHHDPYTEDALMKAIRKGINNQGKDMNVAMPRFNLSDADFRLLKAYLDQLSKDWSPGVTQDDIRFATVITPDIDPARRQVMLDMMNTVIRQKNGSTATAQGDRARHHMTSAAELILGTERKWRLDIWDLKGSPDTWGEQLEAYYRKQPVFAVLSGFTTQTWQPMHDFCDREKVPCWFPSTESAGKPKSRYVLYFSRGVELEADVLARYLRDTPSLPKHVVQIYRDEPAGQVAARELQHALLGTDFKVEDRVVPMDAPAEQALRDATKTIDENDVVMFWLRPADISALNKVAPKTSCNFFSALLARGGSTPLPDHWRAVSMLTYPYELPETRKANLTYFRAWLNLRKIPLVDEPMQSETFFALNYMTDILSEMLENLYRDYLLERAENMLDKREGSKAEQETRDRLYLGRSGDMDKRYQGARKVDPSVRVELAEHIGNEGKSNGTTLYPHLMLGPDQRYASKGAYIVRQNKDGMVEAVSDWIIP